MLIIKSTSFIFQNKDIRDDNEVFDQKKFISKLGVLNKMLSVDSPIRFKIQEGELLFYATMIHSGNNILCKEFGSQIERE